MSKKGKEYWVNKLKNQNLPVLGDVVGELNKITGSDEGDVNQLAEVILRDPNLTSHVLKVANSVHYNYSNAQISTVSRAIVTIGTKGIRAICIASMAMESLLGKTPKERVLALIAQGFHAATQAKNLLRSVEGEEASEEVFIAALLFNLGEMAFWMTEEPSEENKALHSDSAKARRAAMEQILGCNFKAITLELAKQWQLGETLEEALYPRETSSLKVKAVVTGERLSRASMYGWESPQLKKVLKEVSEYTGVSMEESLERVRKGGDQAAEMALSYGVPEACPLIPNSMADFVMERPKPSDKILKGDAALQLRVLRDLASATEEGIDVNTIFQMVLEGMHRGIGLERVCFAFVKGRKLIAKYVLGEGTDHWRSSFVVDIGPYTDNIFTTAMEQGGSHWFTQTTIEKQPELFTAEMSTIIGKRPAFVHALEVDGRKVALFYADRSTYGGKLCETQFESFKHFCQQAQLSLTLLSKKKPKPGAKKKPAVQSRTSSTTKTVPKNVPIFRSGS